MSGTQFQHLTFSVKTVSGNSFVSDGCQDMNGTMVFIKVALRDDPVADSIIGDGYNSAFVKNYIQNQNSEFEMNAMHFVKATYAIESTPGLWTTTDTESPHVALVYEFIVSSLSSLVISSTLCFTKNGTLKQVQTF